MSSVAFIGLGNMGGPMARNLLAAGHAVTVFDLVDAAVEGARAAGASVASSATDAARDAEFVVSMLPAGRHVAATYLGDEGLLARLDARTTVLDCSTIDATTAREVGARRSKEQGAGICRRAGIGRRGRGRGRHAGLHVWRRAGDL